MLQTGVIDQNLKKKMFNQKILVRNTIWKDLMLEIEKSLKYVIYP